jgi:signal transduction histidine kinase
VSAAGVSPGAPSVLVVDDEPEVRTLCGRVLRGMGLAVELSSGPADAAARLAAARFDVVLTDLAMPDPGDGERLMAEVRRRDPAADLLVMTGYPALESAVSSLRQGVYDYLVKPFGPASLQAAVTRCLEKRSLSEELGREKSLRTELASAYGELQKVEHAKEAVLSRVSHEFRTPLFNAFLALDALAAGSAGGGLELRGALERLQTLVEDLLSAAAAGRGACRRDDVDLAALLGGLSAALRREGEGRRVGIVVDVEPAAGRLRGDAEVLRAAFRHLLHNAVRFSRPGTTVRVRAERVPEGTRVAFIDQGPGIPAGELPRVFDSFYQAAEHMSRSMGGLGLGLAIARSAAEAHGGALWVESAEGRGTTFTFLVPERPS